MEQIVTNKENGCGEQAQSGLEHHNRVLHTVKILWRTTSMPDFKGFQGRVYPILYILSITTNNNKEVRGRHICPE